MQSLPVYLRAFALLGWKEHIQFAPFLRNKKTCVAIRKFHQRSALYPKS